LEAIKSIYILTKKNFESTANIVDESVLFEQLYKALNAKIFILVHVSKK